jgi:hypothetical protein
MIVQKFDKIMTLNEAIDWILEHPYDDIYLKNYRIKAYRKVNFPSSYWEKILKSAIKYTDEIAVTINELGYVDLWIAIPFSEIPNELKDNSKHHVINFHQISKPLEDRIVNPFKKNMFFDEIFEWCLNNPKDSISFEDYIVASYVRDSNSDWNEIVTNAISFTDKIAIFVYKKNSEDHYETLSSLNARRLFANDKEYCALINI